MIYLLRHGETEFNRDKRLQGRLDSPLTALGVEQARGMALRLRPTIADLGACTLTSSDLGRARSTAEIIHQELGLGCPVRVDPRLSEAHVGAFDGCNRDEIEAAAPGAMGLAGWLLRAPGGETVEAVAARLQSWLAGIDEADGRTHIVVSHGIASRILRAVYTGFGFERLWVNPPPPQDMIFRLAGGQVHRLEGHWVEHY